MPNKMLIDASHPEETRVVVVRGNRVEEFDFESASRRQLRGNIYLAKVTRVEPSLQACFVDYGGNRHGFLAFSEIHPDYYQIPVADRQALIEEEERAAREADERRQSRQQARSARRDETVSEPAAEHGEQNSSPASETLPEGEANSQIEEVPHDDEAPEEIGVSDDDGKDEHEAGESELAASEPASADLAAEASSETAHDELAGAAEPNDSEHHPAHESGEEQAREARQEQLEDESVEQVGGGVMEEVPERQYRRPRRYKIQEVIKRRQVLLVQVVKEERGTKGAALTTYLSLAGRYSVLMPNTSRGGGISRKITSSQDRQRLKELVEDLEVPEGMGVILRTAGASRTKPEIKRDFEYLLRLWETVRELTLKSQAPALVYEEGSLTKRAIRDLYNKDIDDVIVAGNDGFEEAKEFMRMLMPSHVQSVIHYKEQQPMFARYGVENQLDAMFSPTVQLKSGGYIVINPTEALVSIDVNSGRSTREHHIEDTALKTNSEAAEEIARQLRLRDLAGLIVIDFIDMEEKRNNRHVERKLKDALRHDRARIQVGRISHFGLMEMSRQRIRTGVLESSTEICPSCGGTGHVRSVSSVALQLLRGIEDQLMKSATHDLIVRAKPDVALYVLNNKRAHLRALEDQFGVMIMIQSDGSLVGQQSFVIERGGMARQKPATLAPRISPDSVAVEIGHEDENEDAHEETGETSFLNEVEEVPDTPRDHDEDSSSGRRGGRRRRGRRGRSGGPSRDTREPMPAHNFDGGDSGETHAGDNESDSGASPSPSEARGPDGEPRKRRRRGRRGGRRNRQDRNGRDANSPSGETQHAGNEFDGDSTSEQTPEQTSPQNFESAPEPAPARSEPAQAPQESSGASDESASKRRSTVREPAPFAGSGQNGGSSSAAPAPQESSSEPKGGGEIEADRPRRSGWWSKFKGE